MPRTLPLATLTADLDDLFELADAEPDTAMRRHVPRVHDEAGIDWRRYVTPRFAERFNGLMIEGRPEVGRVFVACFPSAEVLDRWLPAAAPGDLLVTHHPIDLRNGHPSGVWAEGFVPIPAARFAQLRDAGLSLYACHAPMDTSLRVGTAAAIVEALDGTIVDRFWPYGDGHAGLLCEVPPLSSADLVTRAREIFGVDLVEVAGRRRDVIERIAVIGGVGDHVEEMAHAERLGAQAYLTGELHVRIEGEYGRRKFDQVREFAAGTPMTLVGVSHAASEQLVLETQLAAWFRERHGIEVVPLREPEWWR
ncbi:Nif3-like dinuclear metal center hexameric protein [Micromonospora soli]|uniref:Nif3-like dinuclear metal center hexameric protein n=1 Tax=Micromonospora sp. NBRC 110009 TaxID=3061627 RepID=UPI002672FA16|nr:Nif3-like dinuclear metal center hexameric protein [Micromonospora sp. NBRC 110009]WKU00517.1 Nif3-like dinuclear metal center hexameric protein [Micromonospora sp. NBRC 110009]